MISEEKEAIEELKILKEDYWEDDGYGYATAECQKTITALDMAIEALEQEPCEDWYDVPSNEMTLEQARQAVKDLREKLAEYLEQQPCEDCISREEALNVVHKYFEHYLQLNDDICLDGLRSLPSVTPKEKTGKWESTEIFYGGESKGAIIKCSECGNEFKVSPKVFENLYGNERFCNHCGVRMVSE